MQNWQYGAILLTAILCFLESWTIGESIRDKDFAHWSQILHNFLGICIITLLLVELFIG